MKIALSRRCLKSFPFTNQACWKGFQGPALTSPQFQSNLIRRFCKESKTGEKPSFDESDLTEEEPHKKEETSAEEVYRRSAENDNPMASLPTAHRYIRDQIKRHQPAILACGYFQTKQTMDPMYTLYFFYLELSRIVYSTREKSLALGKVDYWQETVENIFQVDLC